MMVNQEVTQSKTILVAEDDEIVAEVLVAMLERLGYKVVLAKDGLETLEKFEEHGDRFFCIILDFCMPKLNGLECLAKIRQQSSIPAILSSGYGDTFDQMDMKQSNIQTLLRKPYTFENIQQALEKIKFQ